MTYVTQLGPLAIKKIWSDLRFGLQQSLPPTGKQSMRSYTYILSDLLSGRAQCWVAYGVKDEVYSLHGFVITFLRSDPLTRDKYLHLYSMYAFQQMSLEDWNRLQDIVEKFAEVNNCTALTSFTNNPAIARNFERRGGKNDWQYWYKEL